MAKKVQESFYCDFCEKQLLLVEPRRYSWGRPIREGNAVCITLGYSVGGWGMRENVVPKFSSEDICEECFSSYKIKAKAFWESLHVNKEL